MLSTLVLRNWFGILICNGLHKDFALGAYYWFVLRSFYCFYRRRRSALSVKSFLSVHHRQELYLPYIGRDFDCMLCIARNTRA